MMTNIDFIANLELPDASPDLVRLAKSRPSFFAAMTDDGPSAAVDDGMLVSFVSELPASDQSDVLNSCLLAQLAANKKYNRESDTKNWYGFYRNVLENVGWVVQEFSFENYHASGDTFSVDQAVLALLASIATGNELAVVTEAMSALKALSSGDQPLSIWNSSSHSQDAGNFQIAVCNKSGGNVVMKNGAFYFTTTETTDSFLWFHYSSSSMDLYQASQTMTLDEDIYSKVRQQVIDKLGDRATQFVADLDI